MVEYVERDKVLREIDHSLNLSEAYSKIAEMPVADVMEVVRCKDCKHSKERNEYEQRYLVDGVLICVSPDATDGWSPVWSDHWCKCGERRTDNE